MACTTRMSARRVITVAPPGRVWRASEDPGGARARRCHALARQNYSRRRFRRDDARRYFALAGFLRRAVAPFFAFGLAFAFDFGLFFALAFTLVLAVTLALVFALVLGFALALALALALGAGAAALLTTVTGAGAGAGTGGVSSPGTATTLSSTLKGLSFI
jgi:hypothetical protein